VISAASAIVVVVMTSSGVMGVAYLPLSGSYATMPSWLYTESTPEGNRVPSRHSVQLPLQTYSALSQAKIDLAQVLGRIPTLAEVVHAAVVVANRHNAELVAELRKDAE
jgi:hypothetical protein